MQVTNGIKSQCNRTFFYLGLPIFEQKVQITFKETGQLSSGLLNFLLTRPTIRP